MKGESLCILEVPWKSFYMKMYKFQLWLSILFCLKDDLKTVGSKKGWCPYFLARHAVSTWASLIVLVSYLHFVMTIAYFEMIIVWRYMGICDLGHTGCKESQFYSLPFGQAVASVY